MLPRVIHRIWLGDPEPEWTKRFASSWEQPGWSVQQWTEEEVGRLFPLINQAIYDQAEEIAPDHVGQLRSDLLRYEILFRYGGVYVDADFECLRPIDPLIEGAGCFAVRVTSAWVNNAILGSIPGHPFMAKLIDGLPANVKRRRGCRPNKISGPQYLTPLLTSKVRVLDAKHFYPFLWDDLERKREEFPDAFAIHWWHNQRRERGLPGVTA